MNARQLIPFGRICSLGAPVLLATLGTQAGFSQVQVSSGYNDEPRNGFPFSFGSGQPVPWYGSSNVTFYGNTSTAQAYDPDEDAILLQNLGSTPVGLTAASIDTYNLFAFDSITNASITLNPGNYVILAGPDGSDVLPDSALATIGLTINGTNYSYTDVATKNAPDGVLEGAMPFIGGAESIPWTSVYSAPTNGVPGIPILGFGSPPAGTNGLNLMLQGLIGSDYEIDASTNLSNATNWQPILYFCTTNSPFYFTAPAATNFNQQFYRAVIAQ